MGSKRLCRLISVLLALLALGVAGLPVWASDGPLADTKICLDPGHGGSDPGAVNEEFDLQESEINLDVSFALEELLEEDGASVAMTRTDNSTYLTNADRYTFCNAYGATILVSVHTNSTIRPDMDGSMALYFQTDDKALAQAIYDVMYEQLRATAPESDNFTDFGLERFASGVLMKSDMPATILEPVIMSFEPEAEDLVVKTTDPACAGLNCRRGEIVAAIHSGIRNYFEPIEPPPSGGAMHVSDLSMSYEKKGANFSIFTAVTVADQAANAVAGAEVSVETLLPDGSATGYTGTTGVDGTVTFRLRSGQVGVYESRVTSIGKAGWTYDPDANAATSFTLTVP